MLNPAAIDDSGFTVTPDDEVDGGFIVRGRKPERWVRQTQFDNDEAVGYLADRLARLGVEDELARQGAQPGASVSIGDYIFDFEPTGGVADEAYQPTRRGTDDRLEPNNRRRADDRLADKKAKRVHLSDEELAGRERATDGPDRLMDGGRASIAEAARTVVKVGFVLAHPSGPARTGPAGCPGRRPGRAPGRRPAGRAGVLRRHRGRYRTARAQGPPA